MNKENEILIVQVYYLLKTQQEKVEMEFVFYM